MLPVLIGKGSLAFWKNGPRTQSLGSLYLSRLIPDRFTAVGDVFLLCTFWIDISIQDFYTSNVKVRARLLPDRERIETLDTLYTAAGTVRGRDAMKLFLRDLLTESERIMLGRRIRIARKLLAGETHREIEASMKVGRDTVGRVERWLHDQLPGYEKAIAELEKEFEKRQFKKNYATSALFRLKAKYPGHFLFFPAKIKK
jgi:uncharacterized protein YerC